MSGNVISILGVLNTKDPEHPKPSRERKMDLDEYYVVVDGEKDIDIQDQEEILKSSKPMIITVIQEI